MALAFNTWLTPLWPFKARCYTEPTCVGTSTTKHTVLLHTFLHCSLSPGVQWRRSPGKSTRPTFKFKALLNNRVSFHDSLGSCPQDSSLQAHGPGWVDTLPFHEQLYIHCYQETIHMIINQIMSYILNFKCQIF